MDVDGSWYVVAADRAGARITLDRPRPPATPTPVPGTRRTEVDGWTIEAVAVPEGVDEVWVGTADEAVLVVRPTG